MNFKTLTNNQAKQFKSLNSRKYREKYHLFLGEGLKCVSDLLIGFKPFALITTKNWIDENPDFRKYSEVMMIVPDKRWIEKISSLTTPTEIIGVFKMPEPVDNIPILNTEKNYVLLDGVQDPGNLGTIIRTCDWFGIYDIFASKGTVDVFNPKVVQATMGSLSRVKIQYLDLKTLIETNPDIKVFGTLLQGEPLSQVPSSQKGVFIMGNEGNGISEQLLPYITHSITIPPANPISHPDSLNVAIATAIILSHFC